MFKTILSAFLGLIIVTASAEARTLRYTQTETSISGFEYTIQGYFDSALDLDVDPAIGTFELSSVKIRLSNSQFIDDLTTPLFVVASPLPGATVVGVYDLISTGIVPGFNDDVSLFDHNNPTPFDFTGFLAYLVSELVVNSASIGIFTVPGGDQSRVSISTVPLPASLPLVIAGTALLGWVGRRKS